MRSGNSSYRAPAIESAQHALADFVLHFTPREILLPLARLLVELGSNLDAPATHHELTQVDPQCRSSS